MIIFICKCSSSYQRGLFEFRNNLDVSGFAKACLAVTLIYFIQTILIIYLHSTNPFIKSSFDDQFASRPAGSPTSAIIYLTSVITSLLTSNNFVRLIALDFSKAFNTLNHSTLITNMASLQLDDSIHNSLISFFQMEPILQNITIKHLLIFVQGSVLCPSSFIINASSLKPVHLLNKMLEFSDDTCHSII